MGFLWIVLLIIGIYYVSSNNNNNKSQISTVKSINILKERYARGEISRDEYLQILSSLRSE